MQPMSKEEYVRTLYELCLGRTPDEEGILHWVGAMDAGMDPVAVLTAIMSSDEAKTIGGSSADRTLSSPGEIAEEALRLLGRRPVIVDVGARLLDGERHVYSALTDMAPSLVVGFDPLVHRLTERRLAEQDESSEVVLLPDAIGDGGEHTLYINNDDATSSLFPLDEDFNRVFNHLSTLRLTKTVSLKTRQLDDILDLKGVDLLKLDVQGAELLVIEGAQQILTRTAVVHCEVEFGPIYAGQPLFADIEAALSRLGFTFVDFVHEQRYHYVDTETEATGHGDRLLWADAVFFRNSARPDVLVAQALVAAAVYRKLTLAAHFLRRAGPRLVEPPLS